mmetsp:Transcript_29153/g.86274  ORF Transcript_29153/g.86274 Transcript_29153/m.86274 type:complete len:85 (-) Transcript_29153:4-258(-)
MVDNGHEVVLEQVRTCAHAWLCACKHEGVNEDMYMSVGAWCVVQVNNSPCPFSVLVCPLSGFCAFLSLLHQAVDEVGYERADPV